MSATLQAAPEIYAEPAATASAHDGQARLTTLLLWVLVAAGSFHAAYASSSTSFLVLPYLFALVQLARAGTARQAFYPSLAVGLLIALGQLSFFWRIFSGGAAALWVVYAFWVALFTLMAHLALRNLPGRVAWPMLPFLWCGLEYFRSELYYLRFSWSTPAFAFNPVQVPLRQVGVYGLDFALLCAAASAAWRWQKSRTQALGILALAAAGLRLWAAGAVTVPAPHSSPPLRIAGVQMEFPTERDVLVRLDELIRREPEAELLVLSEYTFLEPVPGSQRNWCRKHRRYLVVGAEDPAPGAQYYNTAFVVSPTGDLVFGQAKVVPIQFFKDGLPAVRQQVWESPWGKLGICICYDLSYSRVTDPLVRLGAQALIVPTMDVAEWGEHQHQLHARIAPARAAEYGIPVFRLASSGISQAVGSEGQLLAQAPCPGDGEMLAATVALPVSGRRPLDRWLAPFSVGLTGLAATWFLTLAIRQKSGGASSSIPDDEDAAGICLNGSSPVGKQPGQRAIWIRLLRWLVRGLYGFRAFNEEVLNTPGPVLLLPNHVSWFDWIFIGVCLDEDWRFVTSSTTADLSPLHRWIMVNHRTFPVDMASPYAVKHMAEYLQKGGRLVLFPEGRMSCTGSLMKLFDGTGFLIFKTHAKVITACLRGAYRLPLSKNPNRKQWFPNITLHFSPLLLAPQLGPISVTEARLRLTDWLRDQMLRQRFETEMEFGPGTVLEAIARTARRLPGYPVLEDVTLQKLNYRRLMTGAQLLARQWSARLDPAAGRVGVLLPNVLAMPVTLVSLWTAGKIPAILNYTTGPTVLAACARLAGLRQVITSRAFITRAALDLEPLKADGVELVFLEDVRQRITSAQKFRALLRLLPGLSFSKPAARATDTAVVLFTSGSEGAPKGVELTHRNLLANIRQMLSVIDLMETDRFFNALPLFHSFGLTVGLLLPLVQGVFVCLYVSALHYRVVPSAFYNLNCTVFFGTNTFLAGYARKAHPYDFRTLRYLFAGAEKVHESTSNLWAQKFGARILEGYGATECSPCLSVNVPLQPRPGSAGRFLPGLEYRLEPVAGIGEVTLPHSPGAPAQAGRLFVRGPNIMRGYLNAEANTKFLALGGWYDTGDIAAVDADGFVHILGRLKRFAKVSGEMVSLAAVEEALAGAFPQYGLRFAIAVVAKPDEAKGEKLVAVTNEPRLTLEQVREAVRARGLGNLAGPRELKLLPELPHLATGKINHRELERLMLAGA